MITSAKFAVVLVLLNDDADYEVITFGDDEDDVIESARIDAIDYNDDDLSEIEDFETSNKKQYNFYLAQDCYVSTEDAYFLCFQDAGATNYLIKYINDNLLDEKVNE